MPQATARAHSNIAFIKYWGNANDELRLPANSSISMNLTDLYTITKVNWDTDADADSLSINGNNEQGKALTRVSNHLDKLRKRLSIDSYAQVTSQNNFPMGAGIASSASAFAALTVAAVKAVDETISERELSTLARLGSGSASRSVPSGFVEWYAADTHEDSFAQTVAQPDHWDLVDVIAIVSDEHKRTTSQAGHPTAKTSDLQSARVDGAAERLEICKQAIHDKEFETFADVVEYDSNLMHAIMMTSRPALFYWKPETLTIMELIREWRQEGLHVCYTLDAGPNVHCICLRDHATIVRERLQSQSNLLDVLTSNVGGAAMIVPDETAN